MWGVCCWTRFCVVFLRLLSVAVLGRRLVSTTVRPSTPPANLTDGQLILMGGTAPGTGNVLIYHNKRLWSVCDDGWNLHAARVACRSLGYPHALGHTSQAYFGQPTYSIGLDNVQCRGDESSLMDCQHEPFGSHNCDQREAAGVFCAPRSSRVTTRRTTRTPTTSTTTFLRKWPTLVGVPTSIRPNFSENEVYREMMQLDRTGRNRHKPAPYQVRITSGRNSNEGRLEVSMDGGVEWGVVCSDHWTQLEARVACRQAGLGLSRTALQASFFGGDTLTKMAAGIHCDGEEATLSDCYHDESGPGVACPRRDMVAGVVCATELPDLVPNATLLATSTYLTDQPMYYLQCAMEENCASPSAFTIKKTRSDWHVFKRRLLRFSCSIWNFGTADFRPALRKEDWEWHLCHMHYHSMSVFAHYDILDIHGNRMAEGHKASFCLEDVQCISGVAKKFTCKGFSDQGISVGCADDYLHDIDCQWVDVTDLKPGKYVFKVHVNPEFMVAELDYSNNAAICDLTYSGFDVRVTNCFLGRG